MGIGLIVEVLDEAPDDLTARQFQLLLTLAESARDSTRIAFPGREKLMRRMRADNWDAVAKVLRSLAARGLEVRVPKGEDSSGRPVYATHGSQTTYRIPEFKQCVKQVAYTVSSNG